LDGFPRKAATPAPNVIRGAELFAFGFEIGGFF
jgi:hypothetical protein